MRPALSPSGERVHLDLEIRRSDLAGDPVVRRLEDPVNGTVHLPDRTHTTTHVDLDLAPGETVALAAGSLLDGRAVTLDVVVRR